MEFLGREEELLSLRGWLGTATRRVTSQMLAVTGRHGAGKTRLLAEDFAAESRFGRPRGGSASCLFGADLALGDSYNKKVMFAGVSLDPRPCDTAKLTRAAAAFCRKYPETAGWEKRFGSLSRADA